MPRVSVTLDSEVWQELVRLVPSRQRSRMVNEALRKELLRRKRDLAMQQLLRLREKTATLTSRDITAALQRDRGGGVVM